MPNRVLRDWTDSERINSLSSDAERFFNRLIMKVDDYGCLYANPKLLLASLFPLKLDEIKIADISKWLQDCFKLELIIIYKQDEKEYLQINNFKQQLRQKRKKYPLPSDCSSPIKENKSPEIKPIEIKDFLQTHKIHSNTFLSSQLDIESFMMQCKLKKEELEELTKVFNAHLQTENRHHIKFSEWRKNFRNWINTKPKSKQNGIYKNKKEFVSAKSVANNLIDKLKQDGKIN